MSRPIENFKPRFRGIERLRNLPRNWNEDFVPNDEVDGDAEADFWNPPKDRKPYDDPRVDSREEPSS